MIAKPSDIGALQSAVRTGGVNGQRVDARAAGGDKVEGVVPTDSVQLSDTGRALTAAAKVVDEFRADKVAAVKLALEQGNYNIQARIVADRMISEAAQLLKSMAANG